MRVIVVGAGIVGASCAYHLARRGADVRVLERAAAPATGSTGRSAAGLRHQFSHPTNVRFTLASVEALKRFHDDTGGHAGYQRVGYLFLLDETRVPAWCEDRAMQRALGARVERLSPDALADRFPYLDVSDVAEASLGPDDGVVDPHGITLGYLAAARRLGADIRFDAAVRSLRRTGGQWRVGTDVGSWAADVVVNAAGPQAAAVSALAGVDLPVTPYRRCVFMTAPMPSLPRPTPLIVHEPSGVYLRSEGERVLMGLSNPAEAPGENLAIDWPWLETLLERALPVFPFLEEAELDRRACWAGLYAMTPDHLPVLGRSRAIPDLVHACGFSGHGVQHAPATGQVVADEVLDGACGRFDLSDFRFERFAEGTWHAGERNVV